MELTKSALWVLLSGTVLSLVVAVCFCWWRDRAKRREKKAVLDALEFAKRNQAIEDEQRRTGAVYTQDMNGARIAEPRDDEG